MPRNVSPEYKLCGIQKSSHMLIVPGNWTIRAIISSEHTEDETDSMPRKIEPHEKQFIHSMPKVTNKGFG
jgi:hypothetical protein